MYFLNSVSRFLFLTLPQTRPFHCVCYYKGNAKMNSRNKLPLNKKHNFQTPTVSRNTVSQKNAQSQTCHRRNKVHLCRDWAVIFTHDISLVNWVGIYFQGKVEFQFCLMCKHIDIKHIHFSLKQIPCPRFCLRLQEMSCTEIHSSKIQCM